METILITRVLQRLAETIEQAILPNLTSEFASQQAASTASLLRTLAPIVELNSRELTVENADIRRVLESVLKLLEIAGTTTEDALVTSMSESLNERLGKTGVSPHDPMRDNIVLKQALSDVIENHERLKGTVPDESLLTLMHEIRAILRHQIDGGISHWVGVIDPD